jgi:hypothetical protein
VSAGAAVVQIFPKFGARVEVTPLTTTAVADGASDIVEPETVIAAPPGDKVCPDTMYWVCEFAMIVSEPTVSTGGRGVGSIVTRGPLLELTSSGSNGTTDVPTTTSTLPAEVWMAIGVPSKVIVWPGVTVVESPITKFPPDGTWLISIFEGPADIRVLIGSTEVSCTSSGGLSSQPVAVISTIGEQPRHGLVALKFGSVIS